MGQLPDMESAAVRRGMFLTLLVLVTAVFFGLISSFLMACFWAAIFAILFQGVNSWFQKKLKGRKNAAAFLTSLVIMFAVVIPIGLLSIAVIHESAVLLEKLHAGPMSRQDFMSTVESKIPVLEDLLSRVGLTMADLKERFDAFASKAFSLIGERTFYYTQGAIGMVIDFFLMLYLLFFLLRDGQQIVGAIRRAIPVGDEIEDLLFRKFAQVSRATLRGTMIVAACQGFVGGVLFAIIGIEGAVLWGVLMGVLSLLPVGGSGLVWGPAAIILFVQGSVVDAIIIIVVGVLGIGLIDNILRPVLVGRETQMPDYLVLLATLGGLAWFGLSGFIIGPVIAALFITCWEITGKLFSTHEG